MEITVWKFMLAAMLPILPTCFLPQHKPKFSLVNLLQRLHSPIVEHATCLDHVKYVKVSQSLRAFYQPSLLARLCLPWLLVCLDHPETNTGDTR